jgi:DNA-directed RNA polymerase specialized sigma24 family protein
MELTAQVPGITRVHPPGRSRGRTRAVESRPRGRAARELWDGHGRSAYALACALLGNEAAAAEAVQLAMLDLARSTSVLSDGETRRQLALTIYRYAPRPSDEAAGADRLPRSMVWLSRLARLQRASLALCVYGGLTHREAAVLLAVPPSTVAELITAGLREINQLVAADACA